MRQLRTASNLQCSTIYITISLPAPRYKLITDDLPALSTVTYLVTQHYSATLMIYSNRQGGLNCKEQNFTVKGLFN